MIRKAVKSDAESIYNLGSCLHENYRTANNLEQLMSESYFKAFVAEVDGKVVGFLSITELYETVDILDLFVLSDYRKKHIASQLINYMIGDVSEEIELFTLEVSKTNTAAISLYQKFGFEIVSERLFYYDNSDAYLMGLRCKKE